MVAHAGEAPWWVLAIIAALGWAMLFVYACTAKRGKEYDGPG